MLSNVIALKKSEKIRAITFYPARITFSSIKVPHLNSNYTAVDNFSFNLIRTYTIKTHGNVHMSLLKPQPSLGYVQIGAFCTLNSDEMFFFSNGSKLTWYIPSTPDSIFVTNQEYARNAPNILSFVLATYLLWR